MAIAAGVRAGRRHVAIDLGKGFGIRNLADHAQLPVIRLAVVVLVEENERLAGRLGNRKVAALAPAALPAAPALLAVAPRFACTLESAAAIRAPGGPLRLLRGVDFEHDRSEWSEGGRTAAATRSRFAGPVGRHRDRRLPVAPLDLFFGAVQARPTCSILWRQ